MYQDDESDDACTDNGDEEDESMLESGVHYFGRPVDVPSNPKYDAGFDCTGSEGSMTYWWIGTKASSIRSGVGERTGVRYERGDVLMIPKEGLMLEESFTIDFWSKMPEATSSPSGYHSLLSDHRVVDMQHLVLQSSTRKMGYVVDGDYSGKFTTGNAEMPNDGGWHRLTVTVDNQKYSICYNYTNCQYHTPPSFFRVVFT